MTDTPLMLRSEDVRQHFTVTGVVQGVGFRPFVHRIASELGLAGFVGNDSGPAHIASDLGVPTVVIFSETDPAQWGPRSARSRVVSTGVTFRHPRGDKALLVTQARSIDAIREDEVRAACEDVLRP